MGTKHSKSEVKLTEQQKRERADAEHKQYVENVLSRNDASQELKASLIECAELKKNLREVQSNGDFLKNELEKVRAAAETIGGKHQDAVEFNRIIVVSCGVMLCTVFLLLFGLFIHSQLGHINEMGGPRIVDEIAPIVRPIDSSTDFLIIAKQRYFHIMGNHLTNISPSELWELLAYSKDKVTYFQLLTIVQQDFLPKLTLPLIAACMGITLILIAVVGFIAPRWSTMAPGRKLECLMASMLLFLVTGLYLSSVDDSIDIPAGVLLTTGVLLSPLVVSTGFQVAHVHHAVQENVPFSRSWEAIVSSFGVVALSLVLLHTVSFAPLVVVLVGAVSVLVVTTMMVALDRGAATSNDLVKCFIMAAMCVLSLTGWFCCGNIADFILPSRTNVLYPMVTDVAGWLDWSLMLSTFVWCASLHNRISYCAAVLPAPMYIKTHSNKEFRELTILQVGPTANYLYLLLYLRLAADATSTRLATVTVFAHVLWGTYFAADSFFLTLATYNDFGLSEQVLLLNGVLLLMSFTRNYSVLMAYSVVNIAAYVLLKFGVAASAVLAVVAIAVGVTYR